MSLVFDGVIEALVSKFARANHSHSKMESTDNKVSSISSSSTNTQYPSAKAVYDYIQSLDGSNIQFPLGDD